MGFDGAGVSTKKRPRARAKRIAPAETRAMSLVTAPAHYQERVDAKEECQNCGAADRALAGVRAVPKRVVLLGQMSTRVLAVSQAVVPEE